MTHTSLQQALEGLESEINTTEGDQDIEDLKNTQGQKLDHGQTKKNTRNLTRIQSVEVLQLQQEKHFCTGSAVRKPKNKQTENRDPTKGHKLVKETYISMP
ncbi:hypothetical protein Tco_0499392 [Tanacetum coccineum]